MRKDMEAALRELLTLSAERSAADEESAILEEQAGSSNDAEAAHAVILLRLRAGAYATQLQAQLVRKLVDEGDLAGAMDAMHFISSMAYGFYEGARTVFASFLGDQ